MKVWLIKLGEPLPLDEKVRPHRYGILSKMLSTYGNEVVWWTSTFDHYKKVHLNESDTSRKVTQNYRIELLHTTGYSTNISLARIKHHRNTAFLFSKKAELESKPDIILTSYPTPEMSVAAIDFGVQHNIPVVVDIRDLWPDAFTSMFPSPLQTIIKMLLRKTMWQRINRKIFSRAHSLIAISPSYLQWGLNYAGRRQNAFDNVFHMGYPNASIDEQERRASKQFWQSKGLEHGQFILCFFGTINHHFDIDTILQAVRKLHNTGNKDCKFVFCGVGSHLEYHKQRTENLTNVLFPGWVGQSEIVSLMELSSVGLAPYGNQGSISLPNKPFEYFSGGLPVLSSLKGELETILNENQCGITYQQGNIDSFISALLTLKNNPDLRFQMGRNAQILFDTKFSASVVYQNMIEHLGSIVEHGKHK